MERINRHKKTIEYNTHIFYCDVCGKELGFSQEYDDGWYKELGEYEMSFYTGLHGWYKLHMHLCDNCAREYNEKIVNALLDLGFKKD